jgi:hypothetical protein
VTVDILIAVELTDLWLCAWGAPLALGIVALLAVCAAVYFEQ